MAAWFGNLTAYTGLLPKISSLTHGLKKGSNLVCNGSDGFEKYYTAAENRMREIGARPLIAIRFCYEP